MKKKITFLISAILIGFISGYGQIYNKKAVYEYEYQIKKHDNEHIGYIYLGCLGKILPINDNKQMGVIWTKSTKELSNFLPNTGIIESKERVWLHPPRHDEFLFLEYSPFPEIRFPLTDGNKWKWQLNIGTLWTNEEYNINASTVLTYNYEIIGSEFKKCPTHNKMVKCYIVKAVSTDHCTHRSFIGFFNEFYGFISMQFNNINKETITFNLTKISPWDSYNQTQPIFKSNWSN